MGALLGLLLGVGLLLVHQSLTSRPGEVSVRHPTWQQRCSDLLAQAGVEAVTPVQLVALSAALSAVTFVVALGISHAAPIAVAFALFAASAPRSLLLHRRRQRTTELREVWPEVADNLVSAVRAGLSLPEALTQLGARGPEQLRRSFDRFGDDYRATGRFTECLDRLKASLADPVGDRIVESLRMAREVGGSDLGRLLRTLSAFLREDARTRAELEARQSWSVNGARLALAAPWVLLGLLATRPEAVEAYNSAAGAAVLTAGGGVSLLAYRLMLRIGRLPEEQRVLREVPQPEPVDAR